MTNFTEFGDLAVLLPLSATLLLWLLAQRSFRGASWWLIAVTLCAGGTALLKIYFFSCPLRPELQSPSGHAAFSTLVYGAIALIFAVEGRGWRRFLSIVAGTLLVGGIAVSRLALGAHSLLEVFLGLLLGVMALSLFGRGYVRSQLGSGALRTLLLAVAVLATLLHGTELHAEDLLQAISQYLQVGALACS